MTLEEMVERCKKRDRYAQNALYTMFSRKMNAVCYLYTSSREDAKDVLHDGFLKVFSQIHTFNFSGPLEGWIRRIMVNTALNHLRKSKKLMFSSIGMEHDLEGEESVEIAIDKFADLEQSQIVAAINELNDELRVVFTMSCLDNYSHKEISELLQIKETTSRSKLRRAREVLREKLEVISKGTQAKAHAKA